MIRHEKDSADRRREKSTYVLAYVQPTYSHTCNLHTTLRIICTFRERPKGVHLGEKRCNFRSGVGAWVQGFMTGALQSHARRYQLAIDTLSFGYGIKSMEVGADVSDPPVCVCVSLSPSLPAVVRAKRGSRCP